MDAVRGDALIELADEIARGSGRMIGAFRRVGAASGLAQFEMLVLAAVVSAERPPTVPQIGRSLGHPRQVIQRLSDQLAAGGFVVFLENPDHKRARLLAPTAKGRETHASATAAARRLAGQITEGIDPALLRRTVEGLRTIRGLVEDNMRRLEAAQEQEEAA